MTARDDVAIWLLLGLPLLFAFGFSLPPGTAFGVVLDGARWQGGGLPGEWVILVVAAWLWGGWFALARRAFATSGPA